MTHQVLSRKYRPQTFAQVVGQDHVVRILESALQSDRVGHAYLFVGPRGVGKTTMARLFARALNCSGRDLQAGVEPCGTCGSCVDIAAGNDLDVQEMDAASNNHVEDVRELRGNVRYATVRSANRIWIVDEVHMLSLPAFNAFLKTLEEPPASVKFVFCTTEEHKLPDTFRSRCLRVEFRPLGTEAMAARLAELAAREETALEDGVADAIARSALGGMRDAESLLEQLMAACPDGTVRLSDFELLSGRASADRLAGLLAAVADGNAAAALDAVDDCLGGGCKPGVLLDQWLEQLRVGLLDAAREERARESVARCARSIDVLLAKRAHLRGGADGVLIMQLAAVELARLPDARDLDSLVAAVRGIAGGGPAPTAGAGPVGDSGTKGPAARVREPRGRARESRGGSREASVASDEERPSRPVRSAGRWSDEARPSSGPARDRPASDAPVRGTTAREAADPIAAVAIAAPPTSGAQAPEVKPGTFGQVRSLWREFVEALTERDPRLGADAAELEPEAVVNGVLHLRMPRGLDGVHALFSRPETQIKFSQIANHVFGVPLQAKILETTDAARLLDREGPDLREHPVVRLVTDMTKGRLLNVERAEDDEA